MIVHRRKGWYVVSESHKDKKGRAKNLGGPYPSKAAAEKRLGQVEYFKHRKGG